MLNSGFSSKKIIFVVLSLIWSWFLSGAIPEDKIGPEYDYKFGVLVDNEYYQLYRSGKLGERALENLDEYFVEEGLTFPRTIIYMNSPGYKAPFHFALKEYFLQEKYGYKFYHSFGHGVRTYLDGHNPYEPRGDIDTTRILGSHGRKIFDLRDDGLDGDVEDFYRILELVLDPNNQPVLFHCFGGRHRTGMIALAIRYLQGGLWIDGPRFKRLGIEMNLAQFEYYRFNHLFFRKENLDFIEKVSQEERFLNLKERFGAYLLETD